MSTTTVTQAYQRFIDIPYHKKKEKDAAFWNWQKISKKFRKNKKYRKNRR